jgi:hypothetical protein
MKSAIPAFLICAALGAAGGAGLGSLRQEKPVGPHNPGDREDPGVIGNHESALALAAGPGTAREREQATGFALQRLWNRDPAAATALSGSGLAPEQQAALGKKLQQGGFGY